MAGLVYHASRLAVPSHYSETKGQFSPSSSILVATAILEPNLDNLVEHSLQISPFTQLLCDTSVCLGPHRGYHKRSANLAHFSMQWTYA